MWKNTYKKCSTQNSKYIQAKIYKQNVQLQIDFSEDFTPKKILPTNALNINAFCQHWRGQLDLEVITQFGSW